MQRLKAFQPHAIIPHAVILGAALALAACSPTFGSPPEREVIVVPQGTTVVPAR